MTDLELRKLAKMIVQEQARSSEWMNAFAKAQAHNQKPAETLVSAQKAATILGISVWQLYRIKDDEDGSNSLHIRQFCCCFLGEELLQCLF